MLYGPPMRAWLLGTLALVACDGVAVPTDGGPGDAGAADAAPDAAIGPCLEFDGPIELGRLDDPSLDELSGMAASRRHPGLYYAHNDSGDGARIYVLDETAALVEAEFPDVVVERHVSHDSAIRTLLRRAATASHVVVGTRRPGTLRRLFLGSVSHAVVNNAKCPAIVVAPDRVVAGRGRS